MKQRKYDSSTPVRGTGSRRANQQTRSYTTRSELSTVDASYTIACLLKRTRDDLLSRFRWGFVEDAAQFGFFQILQWEAGNKLGSWSSQTSVAADRGLGGASFGGVGCLSWRVLDGLPTTGAVALHRPPAAFSSGRMRPTQVGPAHSPDDLRDFCHSAFCICKL